MGRLIVETAAADLPPIVPTLGAALDACAGMGVNIEIKNLPGDPDFDAGRVGGRGVVAEVRHRRSSHRGCSVSSFHLPTIDRVASLDPVASDRACSRRLRRPGPARRPHPAPSATGLLNPWDGARRRASSGRRPSARAWR